MNTTQRSPADGLDARLERHRRAIWRYLRVLGCDAHRADDMVQEVFARVLASEFEFRDDASARVYLRTTARRLFLDSAREGPSKLVEWSDAVDAEWARTDDACATDIWLDALRECMSQLGPRAREIVLRFYRKRESRHAIAARLGMRENGVKTALQRARETLRNCIERRMGR